MHEKSPEEAKRKETLDYIKSMLGQLRKLAESENCDMLAYLIDMAYLEANDMSRGSRPSTRRDK